ncbi:putative ethanolamine kinase [Helianthus annuus]|nr:putative ethanolamine kinase [Helianthus annuus]
MGLGRAFKNAWEPKTTKHAHGGGLAGVLGRGRGQKRPQNCPLRNQPNDAEVDQLIDDVERYALANHLFWGLWAIISGYVTHIEFDYIEYAKQRFSQYWLKKPQLLKE